MFPYILALIVFIYIPSSIYIKVVSLLLISMILFFICRKKVLIPYLLLTSNMSYEKAKEEAKRIYDKNKLENISLMMILICILFLSAVILSNCISLEIKLPNIYICLPFLLVKIYKNYCAPAIVHGNERSRGKVSFKALLMILVFAFSTTILMQGSILCLDLKAKDVFEVIQNKHSYKVSLLNVDYESHYLQAKKVQPLESDIKFLKEEVLPVVPVDYEVYYVEKVIKNDDKERIPDGITSLRKNKAQSYITNGEDNNSIKHVFYHEYAHVLFNYMDSYKEFYKKYEELIPKEYEKDRLGYSFVSSYAKTSPLEDMCEIYAVYRLEPSLILNEPDFKEKSDLIREYFIKEYGYDIYKE